MLIHVVRHGETDHNAVGRYAGNIDVSINETGVKQALALSEKLKAYEYDLIISSTLTRAVQTAEIINRERNLPMIKMSQFRERELGVYEGLTHKEIEQKYPDMWARNCLRIADDAPDGGETLRLFSQRVIGGIEEVINKYPQKCILLVCHGGTITALNAYFNHLEFHNMFVFKLGNCQYAEYTVSSLKLDTMRSAVCNEFNAIG